MEQVSRQDKVLAATEIYRSLIGNRLSEKYKAVEDLRDSPDDVDLPTLRRLLIKAITGDFHAGKEYQLDDWSISRTRSWLLGSLARLSAGDDEATEAVIAHLLPDSKQDYPWASRACSAC